MALDKLVGSLLGELAKVTKSEAVVGEVRDAGKAKVVPLCKVSLGFGTGVAGMDGSRGERNAGGEGGGAGGALTLDPRAFVVVAEDGDPHLLVLRSGGAVMREGIEIVPEKAIASGDAAAALPADTGAEPAPKPRRKRAKKSQPA